MPTVGAWPNSRTSRLRPTALLLSRPWPGLASKIPALALLEIVGRQQALLRNQSQRIRLVPCTQEGADKKLLVFLGRVTHQKGCDLIAHAAHGILKAGGARVVA
jgi:hypothetical protein